MLCLSMVESLLVKVLVAKFLALLHHFDFDYFYGPGSNYAFVSSATIFVIVSTLVFAVDADCLFPWDLWTADQRSDGRKRIPTTIFRAYASLISTLDLQIGQVPF